jgi:hypothetical protein
MLGRALGILEAAQCDESRKELRVDEDRSLFGGDSMLRDERIGVARLAFAHQTPRVVVTLAPENVGAATGAHGLAQQRKRIVMIAFAPQNADSLISEAGLTRDTIGNLLVRRFGVA